MFRPRAAFTGIGANEPSGGGGGYGHSIARDIGEIEELRNAVALVMALRAGNEAAAREILSLRRGTDFALIEALVGAIEAFGVDTAACRGLSLDELLRRVSLRLAMQQETSNPPCGGPSSS